MLFEHIESKDYKDQKLSFLEKGLILATAGLVKIIIWKAKRAKTYGDLMKLGEYIETKIDTMEDKYGEDVNIDEDNATKVIEDINKSCDELKTDC